ncbi:MAG: hypothetical protein K0R63_1733 [Rickettsiales bacterium]|nr:hypothetical protein [Rickettsiales bacterium]
MSYILRSAILLCLLMIGLPEISQAADTTLYLKDSDRCEQYFTKFERHHALPARILKAIATQESGRWDAKNRTRQAWPWTINVGGKGFYFPTKAKAVAEIKRLKAQGIQSIDVGCMQVNLRYHPDAFRTVEEALNPASNVAYAAKLLKTHYNNLSSWKLAVASYHAGGGAPSSNHGREYAQKVLTYWRAEINTMFDKTSAPTNVASGNATKASASRTVTREAEDAPKPVRKFNLVHNDTAAGVVVVSDHAKHQQQVYVD